MVKLCLGSRQKDYSGDAKGSKLWKIDLTSLTDPNGFIGPIASMKHITRRTGLIIYGKNTAQ